MKQTAVQWLMHQMLEGSMNRETGEMHIKLPKDAFTIAKAMEKEQIVNAVDSWVVNGNLKGEQYYNETYESNT
jgi:hypothetical protein